jgi:hypothetical protein
MNVYSKQSYNKIEMSFVTRPATSDHRSSYGVWMIRIALMAKLLTNFLNFKACISSICCDLVLVKEHIFIQTIKITFSANSKLTSTGNANQNLQSMNNIMDYYQTQLEVSFNLISFTKLLFEEICACSFKSLLLFPCGMTLG